MALDQMPVQQPQTPAQMAGGGIAQLAQYGRNGDTMLAHITPEEAAMLKRMGGAGTINPMTGLPEYGNIFSSIGKAVKKFASSTVGKIITTVALGFFLGPAAAGMLGVTSSAGVAAVSGFVGSAGSTLLAGGKLKDALKAGAIGGLTAGAGAAITGGASAFDSRVMGGANADWSGFGQPEIAAPQTLVQAPPPADLAASIDGSGTVMGPRTNFIQDAVYKPSVDANLVQDVMGSSPKTGGLSFQESMTRGPLSEMAARPVSGPTDLYGEALGNNAYARTPVPGLQDQAPYRQAISPAGNMPPSPTARPGFFESAKNLDFENMYKSISPSARAEQGLADAIDKAKTLMRLPADAPVTKEVLEVARRFEPGMLSTYGPAAALALGATALAGGFKTEPAQMPLGKQETGFDYLNRYPERYKLEFGGISGARNPYNPYMSAPRGMAEGGIAALEMGGTTYPRKTGHINGPGTGTSDSIPALLSDGEFVFTAKAVRAMGQGSRRKGAKKLYSMMKMLEKRQG